MAAELNDDKNVTHSTERIFGVGQIVFGKFEVLAQLGAGNMGQVYKVRDINLDKSLALKVLQAHAREEKDILRFQNEAKTASRLTHPNIATVYDFGLSEDGSPYMAIEFIEGQTLQTIIGRGRRVQLPEFLSIFADVAEALECAHRNGIIHRDVKPGNLMLVSDETGFCQTKVVDFGLAKKIDATDSGAQRVTAEGQLMGTPLYMSPEQTRGLPATAKSDLYSLGCVMYEALAGRTPFQGESVMETLLCHQNKTPRSLKELASKDIPDSIIEMINKLLLKPPEDRFESADEVLEILIAQIEDEEEKRSAPKVVAPEERTAHYSAWVLMKAQTDKRFLPIAILTLLLVAAVPFWLLYRNIQTQGNEARFIYPWDSLFYGMDGDPKPQESKSGRRKIDETSALSGDNSKAALGQIKRDMERGTTKFFPIFAGSLSDDDLKVFEDYQPLSDLDLVGMNTHDRGLKHLSKLKHLKKLNLQETRVATLEGLRGLTSIEELGLEQSDVTDEAMSVVATMTNLQSLKIRKTKITTAGLQKLVKLPKLTDLQVSIPSNYITRDAIKEFVIKNPECRFLAASDIGAVIQLEADSAVRRGDWKRALQVYEAMLPGARHGKGSNAFLVSTLSSCGNCAYNMHNNQLAEKYFKEMITVANRCDECALIKMAYSRLFLHYHQVKNLSAAESTLEKFLQVLKMRGDAPEARLGGIFTLAQDFQAANQIPKAKYWWKKLIDSKDCNGVRHAAALAAYAELERATGEEAQAKPVFEKALAELRKLSPEERATVPTAYIETLYRYSTNEFALKNYDRALEINAQEIQTIRKDPIIPRIYQEWVYSQRISYLTMLKKNDELARYQAMFDKAVKARLAAKKAATANSSTKTTKSGASQKSEALSKTAASESSATAEPTAVTKSGESGNSDVSKEKSDAGSE